MKQWQESSLKGLVPIQHTNELSVYKGVLSTPCVIKNIAKVKSAFPLLQEGFYEIFSQRIIDTGFCDERLTDAINHVIDTCIYPTPTIAQFISFDKKVKTYTYHQIVRLIEDGDNMDNYQSFQFKDRPVRVWIHRNDVAMYKITV
jgi:hypothetical protein